MRISDWSSDVCSSDLSEIRSVELERKIAEGITLIERRDTMEFFRECAAEQFRLHVRKAWMPRTGSRAQHKTLTEIGRASCGERVFPYVSISVVAVSLKQKYTK